MKSAMAILVAMALCADASAGCIPAAERATLRLIATVFGSVKVYVSHSELALGTPYQVIHAATDASIAELNSQSMLVYLTDGSVPYQAPGFEVFATAAGIDKLCDLGYCFGRIN